MVSILPPERSAFDVIGKSIGQNVSSALPGAVQQGYQRQQGLNAIDQLQSDLQAAGGDISKILPAIARAYTLNPNLERSGIAEQALTRAKQSMGTGAVTGFLGGGTAPTNAAIMGQQPIQPQQQPGKQSITEAQAAQPTGLQLGQFIPLNIGELISPEKTAEILDQVGKNGGDVNFTRGLLKDYNEGKIGFNDLQNANVDKRNAQIQTNLGYEDEIKNRIRSILPKGEKGEALTSPNEEQIYYNMIKPVLDNPKTKGFADAWQQISEAVDNFRRLNQTFVKNIPEGQVTGISKDKEVELRNSGQPILKIDPLAYNMLEAAYRQKGHSPVTPAKIHRPLPENIQKTISSAKDFKDLIYPLNLSNEFPERQMQRNLDLAREGQQKEIENLSPQLRKNWNDKFSILNIYADLKAKGWQTGRINELLDTVADKFSRKQQDDRALLNKDIQIPLRYLGSPWDRE
jgi:hypothetical protein